jgi:dCMP deaminase
MTVFMMLKKSQNKKVKRIGWDEYFLKIAEIASSRSTCDRRHVGAVIVKDKVVLSTGYNGSPRGLDHCDDVGHEIVGGHCVRTVHAEANAIAIAQAALKGVSINGACIYLTNSPCYDCFKMIINAGIREVKYRDFYMSRYEASNAVFSMAEKTGIKIEMVSKPLSQRNF